MSSDRNTDSSELVSLPGVPPPRHSKQPPMWVDCFGISAQGKGKSINEDHYFITRFGRFFQIVGGNMPEGSIPDEFEQGGWAMLVADGMGAETGELASKIAISSMVQLALETPDWIMDTGPRQIEEIRRRMRERFVAINAQFTRQRQRHQNLSTFGTTMTVAAGIGTDLFVGHVGNSRIYLQHEGTLHRITRDDTAAQALIDAGIITGQDDEAAQGFRDNLTQHIGTDDTKLQVQLQRLSLHSGDVVLLCTNGLTAVLNDSEIGTILSASETAEKGCRALVDLALERGGRDNVTTLMARFVIQKRV
jgi:PPM family protein phosphatase